MQTKTKQPKTKKTPLSHILKKIMSERKLTIVQIGKMAGVSKSTIADWVSGKSPLDLVAVKRLADALNVSMAFLTTGENDQIGFVSKPSIEDVFHNGESHEGLYHVVLQRLIPKKSNK